MLVFIHLKPLFQLATQQRQQTPNRAGYLLSTRRLQTSRRTKYQYCRDSIQRWQMFFLDTQRVGGRYLLGIGPSTATGTGTGLFDATK